MSAGALELALFDLEEALPAWTPLYDDGKHWERCRDCGVTIRGFGAGYGVCEAGSYEVCDDCGVIDGCAQRAASPAGVEGWPARHVSHWGDPHTAERHAELQRAQARRRIAFLKAQARLA